MDFTRFVEDARVDIEKALRRRVSGQSDEKILWRMVNGGKRLRPLLCVLSFRVCGGTDEDYEGALDVAAAVEFGHCASLCHDDIVDKDLTRRGNPALWVENGISEALMAGHRAISLGLQISLSHGAEIAETFLKAWDQALMGGVAEADARRDQKISAAEYMKTIEEKTASLFSAASKAGSQVAHAPRELQKLMEEYGTAVGVAYQIADDLSELNEGKAGELSMMVGTDKLNGKAYLPDFLLEKMKTAVKKAEMLSRDDRAPKSMFKSHLAQLPGYFVSQILREAAR